MKKQYILIVILLFLALALHAQTFDFKTGSFTANEYSIALPYQIVNDKIIVEVEIKGKKRKFLLDTGAPLAISQELFEELRPTILTKQIVRDINQKTDSLLFVRVDSLKIGGVFGMGIPAIVLKENLIMDCLNVEGFLGSNALQNSVIQFDSQNQLIRIANSTSKLNLDGLTGSDVLLDNQGSPFLKFNIGKKISEYVMFDSGSDVFYSMAHGKVKKFRKAKDFTIIHQAVGSNQVGLYGMDNSEETSLLRIPFVRLNGVSINNIISESSNNNNSRIGSGILEYGVLTLDYKMKKSYFKPFAENTEFKNRQFQINPTFVDNKLCVGKIWTKELEEVVSIGEEIISIDDIRVDSLTLCDAITGAIPKGSKQRKIEVKKGNGAVLSINVLLVQ